MELTKHELCVASRTAFQISWLIPVLVTVKGTRKRSRILEMVPVPKEWYQLHGSGCFEVGEYLAGILIRRKHRIEDLLDSPLANDETETSDAY